jgi:hypothetical protein
MQTNGSRKLKIVLIASIVLNLAFIGGFVAKRYLLPPDVKKTAAAPNIQTCSKDCKTVDYLHLCQKCPGFKETFHSHKDYYQNTSRELLKIKGEFLDELLKPELNEDAVEKLLKEINRLTTELNEKNLRHLLALKNIMEPGDFATLIKTMHRELLAHGDLHKDIHREKAHDLVKQEHEN